MDTNTVNYAIDKLTQGFQAIAPTVQNISEKYVHYVVSKEILLFTMSLLCIPLVVALLVFGFKMRNKSGTLGSYRTDAYENISICSFVFSAIMAIIGCVSIPINGYSAFLAYTNPEMFTIQQVIEQVKR